MHPPLNNFAKIDRQDNENEVNEINLIGGPSDYKILTQEEYEEQLMIHQFSACDQDV